MSAPSQSPPIIIQEIDPLNYEYPFSLSNGLLTPTTQFYVRNHFKAPELHRETHQLSVEGAVENPFTITCDELFKFPAQTATVTLECAGNGRVFLVPNVDGAQWQLGAASTAEWTGIPLARLLDRAQPKPTALEIIFEGADSGAVTKASKPADPLHFARSIPFKKAEQTLLAHSMNGEPLPQNHGFPLRAIIPGYYGMASVKWLRRIIVTDQPFNGYFQTIEYAHWKQQNGLPVRVPIMNLQIKSQIAHPAPNETIPKNTTYKIQGAAWTADATITKVEITTNTGQTFNEAQLLGQPIPDAWRLFEYTWQTPPAPGRYTVMSRATDSQGNTQPAIHSKDNETYMINQMLPIEVNIA